MKKIFKLLLLTILCTGEINAQIPDSVWKSREEPVTLKVNGGEIEGTLMVPDVKLNIPVVLLISGSGPTDRNGNNSQMENNSLKFTAQELCRQGIATLRYDKRGIGQSTNVEKDEIDLRFETYANDAKTWIDFLSNDKRFSRVIVAGHSEGSLLGMLASVKNKKVSAFISIAGAGHAADVVIKEQLAAVPTDVKKIMFGYLDKLKKGDTLGDVPPIFYALFRPGIQPYLISWFKYDPQKEIKKLKIPILILQGTTDIQVKENDALALQEARPKAKMKLIKNMNHVLKECESTDKDIQMKTYDNPLLPLSKEFVDELTAFIILVNSPLQAKAK